MSTYLIIVTEGNPKSDIANEGYKNKKDNPNTTLEESPLSENHDKCGQLLQQALEKVKNQKHMIKELKEMNKNLCRKIRHEIILKDKARTDWKTENEYLVDELQRYAEEL